MQAEPAALRSDAGGTSRTADGWRTAPLVKKEKNRLAPQFRQHALPACLPIWKSSRTIMSFSQFGKRSRTIMT
eukprot:169996-Alexandrium_andersonii.AAC.1